MYRKSRRTIALLVFFTLCLVPTAAAIWISYSIQQPQHSKQIALEISQGLGIDVRLGELRYPKPGQVEYHNLILTHSGHDSPIASVTRLHVRNSGSEIQVDGMKIAAQSADYSISRVSKSVLLEIMRRLIPVHQNLLTVNIASLELETPDERYFFPQVQLLYHQTSLGQPIARIRMTPDDTSVSRPIELKLTFSNTDLFSVTDIRLSSEDYPISLSFMQSLAPWVDSMGPKTSLLGKLQAKRNDNRSWKIQFKGIMQSIDLNVLADSYIPHHLSGSAKWTINHFLWNNNQLEKFKGSMRAGPGKIGTQLIDSLIRETACTTQITLPEADQIHYSEMAFQLTIENGLYQMEGMSDSGGMPAPLLHINQQPILYSPIKPQSTMALARAFSETSSDNPVPSFSLSTRWLTRAFGSAAELPSETEP